MSKAVMLSIRPRWCGLIASGKKTIEVRKTRPKIETPFKCYIYKCRNGKVIGEFMCDEIHEFKADDYYAYGIYDIDDDLVIQTCLVNGELWDYGKGAPLFGWQISDLVIYDEPKELGEFRIPCQRQYCYETCPRLLSKECSPNKGGLRKVKHPPQSWCYVEEWI